MSVLRREVIKEDVRVKRRQLEVGDLEDLRPSVGLVTGVSGSQLVTTGSNTLDPRLLQTSNEASSSSSSQSPQQQHHHHNRGFTLPATSK